jgi:alkylated DNA nucleotide flippase Atl1
MAPTVFAKPRSQDDFRLSRTRSAAYRYRAVRRGEFYSSGFLTQGETLPWAQVLGAVGRPTLKNLTASSAALIYGEIALEAPPGATYQIGDSLLIARLAHQVSGWGRVVSPTGLASVSAVSGTEVRATVIAQFARVADGQVALPVETFADPGNVVPVPVDNGISGAIVATREISPVPGRAQAVVFIDLGRSHGVALGDVFEVLREQTSSYADAPPEAVGLIQIVHVRDRSASGLITGVYDLGVAAGSPVRLTRKMPS